MTDLDLDAYLAAEAAETPRRTRPGASRRPPHRQPRRRGEPVPVNLYPDVAAWVAGFLAAAYAHEWSKFGNEWRWCSRWWLHVEAVVRLEAMWRAWEVLRLDPGTGASTWLLHHADPGMSALTSTEGPFNRCKPGEHTAPPPLEVEQPPPGMFSAPQV